MKADGESHIIRIHKLVIDTKKVKKATKKAFKFAFSQIGLACLVVGYVIMGGLIFMKIESSHELENQEKIEKNRGTFYESVKSSAENLFNNYLKDNFHMKYNQYRNEEMRLREDQIKINLNNKSKKRRHILDLTDYFHASNQLIKLKKHTLNKRDIKKAADYDGYKMTPEWYIKLDRDKFNGEIELHLRNFLMESGKIEDKDKTSSLVREDVWNYANSLLYSATVITTIGNLI
jgi:hypothetical protein